MISALPIVTLALLGQADAFTLNFEGFISTREMNQQQLNKMFRAAFEAVSDEPESLFAVSDSPNADVLASASQSLDEEGLVFHWSLSTTRCPIRHFEFDQHRPRHALSFDEAKVMVREVAHDAHKLLHGHAGEAGLACLEEGESMGGTATLAEAAPGGSAGYGYSSYGYATYGYGFGNRLPTTTFRASGSSASSASSGSTGFTGSTGSTGSGFAGTPASTLGVASHLMPAPAYVPGGGQATVHPAAPSGTGSGPRPVGASQGTVGYTHGGGTGVGATARHH